MFSHFDWFSPMIYWRTNAQLTLCGGNFWEFRYYFRYKEVLSRHSTGTRRRSKEISVSLLENDLEKILEQSQSVVERDYTKHLIGLEIKLCFVSNLTNPINKMFIRLIYLNNSTFLSLKIVFDTDWCQEWTSKHHLAFRRKCSSPFQATATSKVQLVANCIAAMKCLRPTRTLYQTDLRIINPAQRTQIPTITNALFIQNSNRMASSSIDRNRKFSEHIFQPLQYYRQRQSFSAHRAALMSKTVSIFPAISSWFVDFAVLFCFRCKFSLHEKQLSSHVQVDSDAIFLDRG